MAGNCPRFQDLALNSPVYLLNTKMTLVEGTESARADVASSRLPGGKDAFLVRIIVGTDCMTILVTDLPPGDRAWIRIWRQKPSMMRWILGSQCQATMEFLNTKDYPEADPDFDVLVLIKLEHFNSQPNPRLDRSTTWDMSSLTNGLRQTQSAKGRGRQANPPESFNINVRFMALGAKPYSITRNTTVEELKQMVNERQRYPAWQMKVLREDLKEIQDGHTLSSYGVHPGSTVFVLERLFGG